MNIYKQEQAATKKNMKRLTCRKCEGHGTTSILKGHASNCPFNDCNCETCSSVMSMRANALIRRFRHRQPGQPTAVLRTIRSKNGNMRLKIEAKNSSVNDPTATTITYGEDNQGQRSQTESPPTTAPISPPSSILSQSPFDTVLMDYLQLMMTSFIKNQSNSPSPVPVEQQPLFLQNPEILNPFLVQSFLLPQLSFC